MTSPDGRVYSFAAKLTEQSVVTSARTARVVYEAAGNTPRGTTLSPVGVNGLVLMGEGGGGDGTYFTLHPFDDNGDADINNFYDPTEFVIGMRDGTTMRVLSPDAPGFPSSGAGRGSGLLEIVDRSGNKLTFTPAGITSSNVNKPAADPVKSVIITRSGGLTGYITAIQDPNGKSIRYDQSGGDDLTAVTNRVGDTTRYTYDRWHLITAIIDSRGILPIRNLYDADGRLIAVLDAKGNQTTFEHDLGAGKETTTDAAGAKTYTAYDSYGNATKMEKPVTVYVDGARQAAGATLTSSTSYSSDPTNREKPVETRQLISAGVERVSGMAYDEYGDMTASLDPLNRRTDYAYDKYGQVLSVQDALRRGMAPPAFNAVNTYNVKGNLQSSSDALGHGSALAYDDARYPSLPTTVTDALSHETVMRYDDFGRVQDMRDALGHGVAYAYDGNGNKIGTRTARTKADGTAETIQSQTVFDAEDRTVQTIAPDGSTGRTVYNEIGKVSERYDAFGRLTRNEYDELGRQVRTIRPDGIESRTAYDEVGRVKWSASQRVREDGTLGASYSRSLYDEAGRVYGSETWDGEPGASGSVRLSSSYTNLNLGGEMVGGLDALGHAVGTSVRDLAGKTLSSVDALGNATLMAYDAADRQTVMTDALGHVSTMQYDAAGRMTSGSSPVSTTSTAYDALGRRVSETDGSGRTNGYGYDALGRLSAVVDAGSNRTTYQYDELGNKVSQTDANKHVTRFEYDKMGRMTARVLPLGQREGMEYRLDGELNAKHDFNGIVTTMTYDDDPRFAIPLGRRAGRLMERVSAGGTARVVDAQGVVSSRVVPAGSVSYVYYPDGSRRSATRLVNGTTTNLTYFYDLRGRLVKVIGPVATLAYTYDDDGNKTSASKLSSPNGPPVWTVGYEYDILSRLVTVIHPDGKCTTYEYDRVGNRSKFSRPNGIITTYGYDEGNRLVAVNNTAGSSFTYTLDAVGRRTAVNDSIRGVTSYQYDPLGRLMNETGFAGNISYVYDAVGNRTRVAKSGVVTAYQYDANDRLLTEATAVSTSAYAYDDNGDMARRQTTSNGNTVTLSLSYDFEDRLFETLSSSGQATGYTLDPECSRVEKRVWANVNAPPVATTDYLVDSTAPYAQVVEEQASGGAITRYDCGDEIVRMERVGATGVASNGAFYYLYDGLGSTVALADASGNLSQSYAYDAYGNPVAGDTTFQPFLGVSGQQFDSELWLYFLRARYYASAQGRFLSRDKFTGIDDLPVSSHKYIYADDDPIKNTDPSGYVTGSVQEPLTVTQINTRLSVNIFATARNIAPGVNAFATEFGARQIIAAATAGIYTLAIVGGALSGADQLEPVFRYQFYHGTSDKDELYKSKRPNPNLGGGDFGPGFYTFCVNTNPLSARKAAIRKAIITCKDLNGNPKLLSATMISYDYERMTKLVIRPEEAAGYYLKGRGDKRPFGYGLVIGPIGTPGLNKIYQPDLKFPYQFKFEADGIKRLMNEPIVGITPRGTELTDTDWELP